MTTTPCTYLVCAYSKETTGKLLEFVERNAKPDSRIIVFTVLDAIKFAPIGTGTLANYEEIIRQQQIIKHNQQKLVEEAAEELKAKGFTNVTPKLVEAFSAREEIIKQIEEVKADYLVVNKTEHNAIERLLLGTTADYCVRNASCSVVVVK